MDKPNSKGGSERKKHKTRDKVDFGMKITIQEGGETGRQRLKFGSVIITALGPTEKEIRRNIKLGQDALARGAMALTRRGVRIKRQKDVPLFSTDPKDPSLLIRKLNGKKTRGRFIDGQFVEIE